MKLTAIILAGGKSSRMGSDKGLMLLNGKTMIEHIIDLFESMNLEILIVANDKKYESFGYPVFSDLIADKGPIGGIYTGLKSSTTEKNIIVSCDTPFISKEVIDVLISASENENVVISEFDGWPHPLIGIYSKSCINVLKSNMDKDILKVQISNDELNAKVIPMDNIDGVTAKMFSNINTQEDLIKLN